MNSLIMNFLLNDPDKKTGESFCLHWLASKLKITDEKQLQKTIAELVKKGVLIKHHSDLFSLKTKL